MQPCPNEDKTPWKCFRSRTGRRSGFPFPGSSPRLGEGIVHVSAARRETETKNQTKKRGGEGFCQEISDISILTYTHTPKFPKLKPAELNFFFFPFKFGGKTFLPGQDQMCQVAAQKEFLDAGEGGWELKIYGRSAIPEVSELGGQGAATQARSLLQPQLKPASGGLPHGREAGRGLSASRTARPGRCVGRCGAGGRRAIPWSSTSPPQEQH